MRLNLASSLSLLGDNQAAAKLVGYDRLGNAALTANWPALANAAQATGAHYWDQSGYWNSAALLIASGHGDTLVQLYDAARPLVSVGRISLDRLAQPETIIALRKAGRQAEADHLLAQFREGKARLPNGGFLGDDKRFSVGVAAALTGNREAAIQALDHWSRVKPFRLAPIPMMALRYDPTFGWLASDPRFGEIEDRVRLAINAQRQKAGLPPLSRTSWIGDPKTFLTKN